jgi:membrane dipeptidase
MTMNTASTDITASGSATATDDTPAAFATARRLLRESLVWDNHACMPLRPHDTAFLPQLQRLRDTGVDVVMLNIGFGEQGVEDHVRMLASFRDWLALHTDSYRLIRSMHDIAAARAAGQLAVGFDIEGMNALGSQASLVRLYAELGVRWMLVAYNKNNPAGGGCHDDDSGLTPFGRAVLAEMAAVGMLVCCTHTGTRTVREVIDTHPHPVIFSHSNPRAVHDHARNIPDDLIRACAARGGVIGINGIGIFLGRNDASSAAYVRHIDHVAQLVGVQHVGLGLDYVFDQQELDDYVTQMKGTFPPGMGYEAGVRMVRPEQLPEIVDGLLQRGYSDADVQKVLGLNWLRVAQQVWK